MFKTGDRGKAFDERTIKANALGGKIDVGNLIATVTAKDDSWNKFRQFSKTVMCHKRVTARA